MDGLHTELALGLIGCDGKLQTTPFVAKTYQMVCDPRTDALVRWGRQNNSFVVADVAGFSRLLLPCFFKHGNFSSFVRQLNTYGFRKVHPDRWEFAHESFLRGQTHLLPRIVRRRKRGGGGASCSSGGLGGEKHVAASMGEEAMMVVVEEEEDEEEEGKEAALFQEVHRMRQEQTAIGEELARMSRRLQATERRPDQLMSFLARLAEEPSGTAVHLLDQAAEKKRQRMLLPSGDFAASPFPIPPHIPPPPTQPPMLLALGGAAMDGFRQWAGQKQLKLPAFDQLPAARSRVQHQVTPEFEEGGGGGMGLTDGGTTAETPFPFCLLGECFF